VAVYLMLGVPVGVGQALELVPQPVAALPSEHFAGVYRGAGWRPSVLEDGLPELSAGEDGLLELSAGEVDTRVTETCGK
jgi:hypothetical protein